MSFIVNPSTVGERAATNIGVFHMADDPNMYEIQRTNNFEFVVTGLDNLYKTGTNEKLNNPDGVLRLSIISAALPSFTQTKLEVKRGNSTLYYAGVPEFKGGTYTFNDYIGMETFEVLQAWQYLSYNPETEKVGWASDYKKDCAIIQYSPDYQQVRRWKMKGCWITSLSVDNADNASNLKCKISCEIQYDKAYLDRDN